MIFVTGDTHGLYNITKIEEWKKSEIYAKLTKNDFLIILGDWGGLWYSYTCKSPDTITPEDELKLNYWESLNCSVLFIDGNHDNHKALNRFPVEEWNGGKVHKITPHVFHLMRGQIFTISGIKIFTLGGANSVDKHQRTPDVSWWAEEIPSNAELDEAITNLEKNNFTVDYVLTHCCGLEMTAKTLLRPIYQCDTLMSFLDHIELDWKLQYKHWYFGHHHLDVDVDEKHTCVFEKVFELTPI